MHFRLSYGLALLLLAGLMVGCSREEEKVIAAADDNEIRVQDFQPRYQKYLEASGARDNIVQRKIVLQNMINELLIVGELRRAAWFDLPEVQKRMEEIRTQARLDHYAMKHIAQKVQVSETELREEFRNANAKVSARYLYAKSEREAWELKRRISSGSSFESLARNVFDDPGLANNGGYLGYFARGEMDTWLEETAFSLSKSEISDPVKIGVGYAIIKVEDRVDHPLLSEYDFAKQKPGLEEGLRKKKTKQAIEETVRSIAHGLSPRFNEDAVRVLFDQWGTLKEAAENIEEKPRIELDGQSILVQLDNGTWSISDFLEKLEFTTSKQRARVKSIADLKEIIVGLAAREVLIERATEEGLENDVDVKRQISHVKLQYALTQWRLSIEKQIGARDFDNEIIRQVYEKNKTEFRHPPEVNVAEILVRTKDEAENMRQRVDRGEDFASLAKKFSIRLWAVKQGGELGFGTIEKFGILGEKLMKANVGQTIGPEFVDPYYGVFKVLAKREGRQKKFEESRESILEGLRRQRKQDAMRSTVEALRAKAQISVDEEVLANVKVE